MDCKLNTRQPLCTKTNGTVRYDSIGAPLTAISCYARKKKRGRQQESSSSSHKPPAQRGEMTTILCPQIAPSSTSLNAFRSPAVPETITYKEYPLQASTFQHIKLNSRGVSSLSEYFENRTPRNKGLGSCHASAIRNCSDETDQRARLPRRRMLATITSCFMKYHPKPHEALES